VLLYTKNIIIVNETYFRLTFNKKIIHFQKEITHLNTREYKSHMALTCHILQGAKCSLVPITHMNNKRFIIFYGFLVEFYLKINRYTLQV